MLPAVTLPAVNDLRPSFGKCPCCGSDAVAPFLSDIPDYISMQRFTIGRCGKCGLLISERLAPGDDVSRYYGQRYRGNRHSFTATFRTNQRVKLLLREFPADFRGRLLDIGCGNGDFLRAMKSRGWNVTGTEMDERIVTELRAEDISAHATLDLSTLHTLPRFDAITCWHVLEHNDDPAIILRDARQLLAAGGVFQISVPDTGSWHARVCGKHWLHYDVPRHRVHFAQRQLAALLDAQGLEIRNTSHSAIEYDWFGVVQGILNRFSRRPNGLFERLTHGSFPAGTSTGDKLLAFTAGPVLCLATFPFVAASAALGGGGTLTVSCTAQIAEGKESA